MSWILSAEEIQSEDRHRVGGKGYALSLLAKNGFTIPRTVCITSDAYQEYLLQTGLRERILMELHRKDFKEMRWEEIICAKEHAQYGRPDLPGLGVFFKVPQFHQCVDITVG